MSAFGVMVAAPFGVTNGTILKPKCDISCVPNLTFGEGEAMRRPEFLSGMAWWSLVTLPSLTAAQTFPAVSSNLAFASAALPDPADTNFPYTEAMTLFARGIGAARSGNPTAAGKDVARLTTIVAVLRAAKNDYWATEVEVQRLGVTAWIAFAEGKRNEAIQQMGSAADMEDASEKASISPGRILPARELLGDMLLESGRPGEALTAYESSLVSDPKRMRSYNGAAQAALGAGNASKARDYFSRMIEMADANSPRPELIKARQYLAAK